MSGLYPSREVMFRKSRDLVPARTAPIEKGHAMKVVVGGVETVLHSGETVKSQRGNAAVDVVLVFDTTGSMFNSIEGMRRAMVAFAKALESKELDWRLVCVPFGDLRVKGDRIVGDLPWVDSVEGAQSQLSSMPMFAGGGNGGESSYEALMVGLEKKSRNRCMRVVVLITDDAPHEDTFTTKAMAGNVVAADALMYAITSSPHPYRHLAELTGGSHVMLGTDNDVSRIVSVLMSFADGLALRLRKVHELGGGSPQRLIAIERGSQ